LRPESTKRRRSRLVAGRNFGGAQADVTWISSRRSRSARRRPGVPLAGQRGHATVWLGNQQPEPGGTWRHGDVRGAPAAARSACPSQASRVAEEWEPWWAARRPPTQGLAVRLELTRRCRWRRCGGRESGGAVGAASGRYSGRVAGAGPAHGATAPACCSFGLLLIAALGEFIATVGATGHPPAVQKVQGGLRGWLDVHGASLWRRAGTRRACRVTARQRPGPGAGKPGAGRRAAARGPDRRAERSGLGDAGKGATLGRLVR
jgi:hypothetical protein